MISQTNIAKASSLLISGTNITKTNILDELPNNNSIAIADNKFTEANFEALLTNVAWPLAAAKDLYSVYGDKINAQEVKHLLQVDYMQREILTELIPAIKSINSISAQSLGYTYAHIVDKKEIEYEKEGYVNIVDVLSDAVYKAYALANGHVFNATIDSNNTVEFKNTFKAKELILEVDKQNSKPFNQINIKTGKIEKIIIGTSKDGIEFKYITYKQKAVYESSIDIKESTDRFIRIIFIQKETIPIEAGKFVHRAELKELSVGMKAQKELLNFETPEYIINKTCSYVGLQDKVIGKGLIKYKASINGKEFADITNVNIAINEFFENKLLALDNTVILEPELVATNELMIFDATTIWEEDDVGLYGWFKFNKDTTIETGMSRLIIDGNIKFGTILITKGIHRIHLIDGAFINYFNEKYVKTIRYENNTIIGTDIYGTEHSMTDALYPNNTKYIVELNGIALGRLTTDKILLKGETGYQILSTDNTKYNVAFRSTIGTLNTIKIKGVIDNAGQIEPTVIQNIFVNII